METPYPLYARTGLYPEREIGPAHFTLCQRVSMWLLVLMCIAFWSLPGLLVWWL